MIKKLFQLLINGINNDLDVTRSILDVFDDEKLSNSKLAIEKAFENIKLKWTLFVGRASEKMTEIVEKSKETIEKLKENWIEIHEHGLKLIEEVKIVYELLKVKGKDAVDDFKVIWILVEDLYKDAKQVRIESIEEAKRTIKEIAAALVLVKAKYPSLENVELKQTY